MQKRTDVTDCFDAHTCTLKYSGVKVSGGPRFLGVKSGFLDVYFKHVGGRVQDSGVK